MNHNSRIMLLLATLLSISCIALFCPNAVMANESEAASDSYHPADTNSDNVISMLEILAYFDQWAVGDVTMLEVLEGIDLWAAGHYCWDESEQKFKPDCDSVLSKPTGVTAVAGDGQIILNWNEVDGALAYHLYWNTTGNVTLSDNKISNVTAPYYHNGIAMGTTYYYVVTAANTTIETEPSNEVSSTAHMIVESGDILAADSMEELYRIDPVTGKASYVGSVIAPIAVDSQGHVLNGYEIIDPETGTRSKLCCVDNASSTMGGVTGIAVDVLDTIYVTTERGDFLNPEHYLGSIDPATQTYTDIAYIAVGYGAVSDLAVDTNGDVIVVGTLTIPGQSQANYLRVMRVDPETGAQTRIDLDPFVEPMPSAIAVGPDGYFYIAFGESDPILRVDPATGQHTEVRTVRRATSLAFDANGDLLIADYGSKYGARSYIIRVDLDTGQSTTLIEGIQSPRPNKGVGRFLSIAVIP